VKRVGAHADKAEALLPVEAGADGLGVVDGCNLRTVVLRHRETAGLREAVGLGDRRILVEVLGGEAVCLADVVVEEMVAWSSLENAAVPSRFTLGTPYW
jgi:hypothetical protein